MQEQETVNIYSLGDPIKAQLIKNALEDEAIPCILAGIEQASSAAIPGTNILVQVPEEFAEQALAIIKSHDHVHPDDEEDDVDDGTDYGEEAIEEHKPDA